MEKVDWIYLYLVVSFMCAVVVSLAYCTDFYGIVFITLLILSGAGIAPDRRQIYYKYVLGKKGTLIINLIWTGLAIYVLISVVVIPWHNVVNNLF